MQFRFLLQGIGLIYSIKIIKRRENPLRILFRSRPFLPTYVNRALTRRAASVLIFMRSDCGCIWKKIHQILTIVLFHLWTNTSHYTNKYLKAYKLMFWEENQPSTFGRVYFPISLQFAAVPELVKALVDVPGWVKVAG